MIRKQLSVFTFYALLTALALNRLILHINEYVGIGFGGTSDYFHAHWNYWWIRKALSDPDLSVYYTNYALFPFDNNLAFHTLAAFWFPLWALLEPMSNIFVAMNVILWLGLTLTGYFSYLFLRDQGVSGKLALVGGALMSVMPHFTSAVAMTLPQYVAGFWFAVPLMLWWRIWRTHKPVWALLLGVVFWCILMTDISSLLIVAFTLAPYALWTLLRSEGATQRGKLIVLGLLPFGVLLALAWFIAPLEPMLDFDRSAVSAASLDSAQLFSLPLRGLLPYDGTTDDAIGLVIVLLTLISVLTPSEKRGRWLWFGLGVLPLLLAFGPDISIAGTRVPMPYRLVHELTSGVFRAPSRFAPAGVLMWLVFIGQTWTPILSNAVPLGREKGLRIMLPAVVLLLIMADLRVMQPFEAGLPTLPYGYYETIAREPYDELIIEVPVSIGSGWIIHGNFTEAQFYGITHGKRMMNGLIARVPGWVYEFFLHDPTIGWLGGFRHLDPEVTRMQLGDYSQLWGTGYIVVHQDHLNKATGQAEEIIGFLNELDYLCPVTVERDAVFYRTFAHPDFAACPPRRLAEVAPKTWEINFGQAGDELFIGMGFQRAEIIGGPTARWLGAQGYDTSNLFIDLPPVDYQMTVRAFAFNAPKYLSVFLGERELGRLEIQTGDYQDYILNIPADALNTAGEKQTFRLVYDKPISAADLGLSTDERPLSIALDWIRFTTSSSAGE